MAAVSSVSRRQGEPPGRPARATSRSGWRLESSTSLPGPSLCVRVPHLKKPLWGHSQPGMWQQSRTAVVPLRALGTCAVWRPFLWKDMSGTRVTAVTPLALGGLLQVAPLRSSWGGEAGAGRVEGVPGTWRSSQPFAHGAGRCI